MKISIRNSLYAVSVVLTSLMLQACPSSGSSSDEDTSGSTVTLSAFAPVSEAERQTTTAAVSTVTANGNTTEIVGAVKIKWTSSEPNRSTVDISLSSDSGQSYPTIIATRASDSGEFVWDTNLVDDCRTCRLRIVAQDVVGNRGAAADSAQDFIINNVPQVLGAAIYYDVGNNGPGGNDTLVIPFDKNVELRTETASDVFIVPVLGDSIGRIAAVKNGSRPNELVITMDDAIVFSGHLHVGKLFDPSKLGRTAPSGLNIRDNLASGILFAPDTNRTAATISNGIDISPGFAVFGQVENSGSSADKVLLGDLDGDGDQDVVTSRRVYRNDGKGAITQLAQSAFGLDPGRAIALGDLDGDGDLDLVEGKGFAGAGRPNLVYRNDGTGIFADTGQALGNFGTGSLALGDLDGDGDLDLVEGNIGEANRVYRNKDMNSGVFEDTGQAFGDSSSHVIALGDLDGDGDLDLIEGNGSVGSGVGSPNRVYRNDGTGMFTDTSQLLGDSNTQSVALGDIDGDGDLDLIEGNGNGGFGVGIPNRVYRNDGKGLFADSGAVLGSGDTFSVILADFDEDGDLDLIAGSGGSSGGGGGKRVYRNDGKGNFTDTNHAFDDAPFHPSLALGDMDGDGDLDLLQLTPSDITILTNSLRIPSRTFLDSGQTVGISGTSPVDLGDLDGDKDLDLVAGNHVYLNDGAARFTDTNQPFSGSAPGDIALGDLDGDKDLDLVADNRVFLNDGMGMFADTNQPFSGSAPRDIALGDLDGDKVLDLVADDRVYLNDGAARFTDTNQSLIFFGSFAALVLGDLDGDKDLDLVSGDRVYRNNDGRGTFVDTGQLLVSGVARGIGNLDADGDLDLVTQPASSPTTVVHRNNGTGAFTQGQSLPLTGGDPAIALGDLDGDGDLDLVEGNPSGQDYHIYRNDGAGKFTDFGEARDTSSTRTNGAVALGDLDGDGDLDLVEGFSSQGAKIWLNDL
jgi:hypothetical protein